MDAKLAVLGGPGSRLENVRTVMRSRADQACRGPGTGCLTATASVEARGDPEAVAVLVGPVGRLEAGSRDSLARALRAGEIAADVRPDRLARALTIVGYGIGVLARLPDGGPRIADTVSALLGRTEAAAT